MATVPFTFEISGDNNGAASPGSGSTAGTTSTAVGFYVNVATAPVSTTCLLDWDLGGGSHFRMSLKSDLTILVEARIIYGQDTSGSLVTGAIDTGRWWWISATGASDGFNTHTGWIVGLWSPDGQAYSGWFRTNPNTTGSGSTTFSGPLGWGAPQTSSYAAFPNDGSHLMSKLYAHIQQDNTWLFPLAGDPSGGTINIQCREAPGAAGVLHDSSGNGYDLTAVGAATVYAVGPYA